MMDYVKVLMVLGEKTSWFHTLPEDVQVYINTLGVDEMNFK